MLVADRSMLVADRPMLVADRSMTEMCQKRSGESSLLYLVSRSAGPYCRDIAYRDPGMLLH